MFTENAALTRMCSPMNSIRTIESGRILWKVDINTLPTNLKNKVRFRDLGTDGNKVYWNKSQGNGLRMRTEIIWFKTEPSGWLL
jgi:hypothetical protein